MIQKLLLLSDITPERLCIACLLSAPLDATHETRREHKVYYLFCFLHVLLPLRRPLSSSDKAPDHQAMPESSLTSAHQRHIATYNVFPAADSSAAKNEFTRLLQEMVWAQLGQLVKPDRKLCRRIGKYFFTLPHQRWQCEHHLLNYFQITLRAE